MAAQLAVAIKAAAEKAAKLTTEEAAAEKAAETSSEKAVTEEAAEKETCVDKG